MTINQETAVEQYQTACDCLMEIAQNYEVPEKASEAALAAANYLTLKYIEQAMDDINQLNAQYAAFVNYMESVVSHLENTLIDDALIIPLQNALDNAQNRIAER